MNREHVIAAIADLDVDLRRHVAGEDAELRRIAAFCRTTLALHAGLDTDERTWVNARLAEVACRHALPDACVPPHSAECVPAVSTASVSPTKK